MWQAMMFLPNAADPFLHNKLLAQPHKLGQIAASTKQHSFWQDLLRINIELTARTNILIYFTTSAQHAISVAGPSQVNKSVAQRTI